MMEDKIVVFGKYESAIEANIVKGVLETNGVIAGVMEDGYAETVLRGMSAGAVRVVVFERDLERAREIMNTQPVDNQGYDQ